MRLPRLTASSEGDRRVLDLEDRQDPERRLKELSGLDIDELWQEAEGASVGLKKDELATVLLSLGLKHNYGLPPGAVATRGQMGAFWRGLLLRDLALAHACALGRDAAWQQFMARFRELLTQAAISITGSVAMGCELADSLYAELFGLTERGEQRRSPLAYYSGRGSLKAFYEQPWHNCITELNPAGAAVRNLIFSAAGNCVSEVNFANHGGTSVSGARTYLSQMCVPLTGHHAMGTPHVDMADYPAVWRQLPGGVNPATALGT